ncbi:unnamed protein product [Allacma fusca]|uniref:Eukaryotic translation initiation factor 3 subunit I n=1 Tax=Allacma fusca TaxID=39272 RepID=A0A8J2PDF1_9HEXA|nr:unnamed protein product [Allacma fusca]
MFITASKDKTSKLFDTETLECLKTYKTDRPVNSATISPNLDHVVLGGGQEAMDVTRTATSQGKFEARFFDLVYEDEFARVKGHFGPINSLAFHPGGRQYAIRLFPLNCLAPTGILCFGPALLFRRSKYNLCRIPFGELMRNKGKASEETTQN